MSGIVISGIGVALALTLMAILIFKGVSPVFVGPIAVIVICITSRLDLLSAITNDYMTGVSGYFKSYFLVFLLGNLFGNFYQISGAATKIGNIIARIFGAKRVVNCMIASAICAAVLSYGGINSFVIIFAVYPIVLRLFEEADVPTHLLPGIVCGGMWTFAMTGPFTPQIPNIIPMQELGTTASAGLVPGLAAAVVMFVLIIAYMTYSSNKCKLAGMHYEKPTHIELVDSEDESKLPNGYISAIPLLVVILGFNLTGLGIVAWLTFGNIVAAVLFWNYIPAEKRGKLFAAAAASAVTININTAAIVGFGNVSKLTPFYGYAVSVLTGTSGANPYVVAAVGANTFAAILGSSSGGLALMFTSLKDTFLAYGQQGYNMGYIHRLMALASGCLDTTPWNGSIVSVFNITGTTHSKSFKYNFVTCGVIPIIACFAIALPICMLTG